VPGRNRLNHFLRLLYLTDRDVNPHVFEDVRDLSKERENSLKSGRQQLMHAVFHRAEIPHVVDVDSVVELPDPLDAALPLLKSSRVPRQVEIDERAKGERMIELKAAPNKNGQTEIRYTTDGSSPQLAGGTYDAPVTLKKGTPLVLAYAMCDGIESPVEQISIDWTKKEDDVKPIDPEKLATWKRPHAYHITQESYDFIDRLKRHEATASGLKVSVTGDRWAELNLHEKIELGAIDLNQVVEVVRKLPGSGQLGVEAGAIHFARGQQLLDWVNEVKTELRRGEVVQ